MLWIRKRNTAGKCNTCSNYFSFKTARTTQCNIKDIFRAEGWKMSNTVPQSPRLHLLNACFVQPTVQTPNIINLQRNKLEKNPHFRESATGKYLAVLHDKWSVMKNSRQSAVLEHNTDWYHVKTNDSLWIISVCQGIAKKMKRGKRDYWWFSLTLKTSLMHNDTENDSFQTYLKA